MMETVELSRALGQTEVVDFSKSMLNQPDMISGWVFLNSYQ